MTQAHLEDQLICLQQHVCEVEKGVHVLGELLALLHDAASTRGAARSHDQDRARTHEVSSLCHCAHG